MNKKSPITPSTIEERVMDKIQSGRVHMRPRAYYVSLSVLGILVVALLGFVSSYFMSVMSLWIRVQAASGPAYGAKRNLDTLMAAFPWWALLLGLLSLIATVYFVRKVGRLYKIRLSYLIPVVVATFLVLGFIFSYGSLPKMFNHQNGTMMQNKPATGLNSSPNKYLRGR